NVNAAQKALVLGLRAYRMIVSPVLTVMATPIGLGCRYEPSCSQYAIEAVQKHGSLRGVALAVWRVCRCHPWGGCGFDPVPEKTARGLPHSRTLPFRVDTTYSEGLGMRQPSASDWPSRKLAEVRQR